MHSFFLAYRQKPSQEVSRQRAESNSTNNCVLGSVVAEQWGVVQGGERPVEFAAAKSAMGHSEAGAGVLGMVHAIQRLRSGQTKALTHLSNVNPHVVSILDAAKGCVSLPRQHGPGQTPDRLHIGISSFAFQVNAVPHIQKETFSACANKKHRSMSWLRLSQSLYFLLFEHLLQGTNAHLILREEQLQLQVEQSIKQQPWQRRRFWHSPAAHALLHRASASAATGIISAEGSLDRTAVAFLQDHKVRFEHSVGSPASSKAAAASLHMTIIPFVSHAEARCHADKLIHV